MADRPNIGPNAGQRNGDNRKLISRLMIIVIGMFGFGFAMVPIYDVFCDLTGLNGKTGDQVTLSEPLVEDTSRLIRIEFTTTLNDSMPWEFRSTKNWIEVHPGKPTRVDFIAINKTESAMTGQAIPSVAPGLAAPYMHKTECFCFAQQTLEAGEKKTMPVIFYIDPEIPQDVHEMTLSYTFFVTEDQGKTANKPLALNSNHQEI